MKTLASVLLILVACATQVAVEALSLDEQDVWAQWTGLLIIVGLLGYAYSLIWGE